MAKIPDKTVKTSLLGTEKFPLSDSGSDRHTEIRYVLSYIATERNTIAGAVMRTKLVETCNGTAGQVIAFSSIFVSTYALQIIDYDGIGITSSAQDENGFTIESLSAGNFGYIALIEI